MPKPCFATRPAVRSVAVLLCCLILDFAMPLQAQLRPGPSSTEGDTPAISGRVINAATGQPIPRALVQLGTKALLTDREGKFEFAEVAVAERGAPVRVTKPGFYDSPAAQSRMMLNLGQRIDPQHLDAPIELRLYPEAVIAGTVTSSSGEPLERIPVQAQSSFGEGFGQRWQANTDSHGGFRIPLPPGDYQVTIPYIPHPLDLPEAVLPLMFPGDASTKTSASLHLASGMEEHLDLRPETRPTHVVSFRIESNQLQAFPQLQARFSTGQTLMVASRPAGSPGEYRTDLPSGSYTLIGNLFVGAPANAETLHAETAVVVDDRDVSGVVLHFAPIPAIPVELAVDAEANSNSNSNSNDTSNTSNTSDNDVPNLQQLGLSAHNSDAIPGSINAVSYLMVQPNETPAFHLLPGSYRIEANPGGRWYVKSILEGGTDLLSQPLVVAPSAGGASLQVVVSNRVASLKGTLTLKGKPARCAIYLLATTPSASPLMPLLSQDDGSFYRPNLPPGSYLAIGFEGGPGGNLLDPEVQAPFSTYIKSFSVQAGETANLNLEAVPVVELKP